MALSDFDDLSRRDILRFAARATPAITILALEQCRIPLASAQETGSSEFEFFSSPFTTEALQADTLRSVREILDGPRGTKTYPRYWARAARQFFDVDSRLPNARELLESRMLASARTGIQSADEVSALSVKYRPQLHSLCTETPNGKYCLLLDIDTQRMHLIKNHGGRRIQFIKYYVVSTAKNGASNQFGSEGTPTGMHWIRETRTGLFGEDVSATGIHAKDFDAVIADGETSSRSVAKGLSSRRGPPGLISGRFLLGSHDTQPQRGANIHGTPHEDLLGREASGGCARVSNVSILELLGVDSEGAPYLETSTFKAEKGRWEVDTKATPIMIVGGGSVFPDGTKGLAEPQPLQKREIAPPAAKKGRPPVLPGYFD